MRTMGRREGRRSGIERWPARKQVTLSFLLLSLPPARLNPHNPRTPNPARTCRQRPYKPRFPLFVVLVDFLCARTYGTYMQQGFGFAPPNARFSCGRINHTFTIKAMAPVADGPAPMAHARTWCPGEAPCCSVLLHEASQKHTTPPSRPPSFLYNRCNQVRLKRSDKTPPP